MSMRRNGLIATDRAPRAAVGEVPQLHEGPIGCREAAFGPRARNLNPSVTVANDTVVLDTAAMGAVPAKFLRKPVINLGADRAQIADALDTLFGAC